METAHSATISGQRASGARVQGGTGSTSARFRFTVDPPFSRVCLPRSSRSRARGCC
ncbi:hypothetical protein ZHAS_00021379 [Anopheles sinensis]|uniref:Uncharacterized protein n=1 Tax=Anopheles sinensis TaxID=74873 RepID=A0A084WS93_ANOSI|nr:hypothetical protein ZHAS_00021379 [Anopheles sinensis]